MAEKLAEDMAKHYEEKNLFVRINDQTWKINETGIRNCDTW